MLYLKQSETLLIVVQNKIKIQSTHLTQYNIFKAVGTAK